MLSEKDIGRQATHESGERGIVRRVFVLERGCYEARVEVTEAPTSSRVGRYAKLDGWTLDEPAAADGPLCACGRPAAVEPGLCTVCSAAPIIPPGLTPDNAAEVRERMNAATSVEALERFEAKLREDVRAAIGPKPRTREDWIAIAVQSPTLPEMPNRGDPYAVNWAANAHDPIDAWAAHVVRCSEALRVASENRPTAPVDPPANGVSGSMSLTDRIARAMSDALSPPVMGMGGGSATEERARDRWRVRMRAEVAALRDLRRGQPEALIAVDAIAKIVDPR